MYLIRVSADVLAHLNELVNLEVIQARGTAETVKAAALKFAVGSALLIETPAELIVPYRVELQLTGPRKALLWDDATIVAWVPIREHGQLEDVDRAYCMAHALPLRQIVESFLRMDWSPSPEITSAQIISALARAPLPALPTDKPQR